MATTTTTTTAAAGLVPIFPNLPSVAAATTPQQQLQLQAQIQARAQAAQQQQQAAQAQTARASKAAAEQRRKERNREHARRSRERKKNEQEKLEQELEALREEHAQLQRIIQQHLPNPQKILHECNPAIDRSDFELLQSLAANKQPYVISDPRLPDNPIVYASERFCLLTGFSRDEIVGRNCRILQGPQTDPRAVAALGKAVQQGSDCTTTLLNYKKDGTPFWNNVFVAALRDGENNIVNYVGVQCEREHGPGEEPASQQDNNKQAEETKKNKKPAKRRKKMDKSNNHLLGGSSVGSSSGEAPNRMIVSSIEPLPLPPKSIEVTIQRSPDCMFDDSLIDPKHLDWSMLAEVFEADELSVGDGSSVMDASSQGTGVLTEETDETMLLGPPEAMSHSKEENSLAYSLETNRVPDASPDAKVLVETESFHESYLRCFCASPLEIISRTVRSELLDSLLTTKGDVSADNKRFLAVLAILERIYQSLGYNASPTNLYTGSWRSLDRPHYGDCLGTNDAGDFLYTLGKMSFDMFQPGHLKCSVQRTMNTIETVCQMSAAPSAAPWSLRRELAATACWDDPNRTNGDDEDSPSAQTNNTHLKSYDISVALTVEPYAEKPLKALNVTKGYMLPDPKTPNRLTVWFTGGTLSPVANNNKDDDDTSPYGGVAEWKELFGAQHKRTWSESFRVMGAKLLMGAELPDGMEEDGTLRYMLHRPMGGHGVAYVDVLYLDDDLLVLKSSSGKVHVMARDSQTIPVVVADEQQQQQQQQAVTTATTTSSTSAPPPLPPQVSSSSGAAAADAAMVEPLCPKKRPCEAQD